MGRFAHFLFLFFCLVANAGGPHESPSNTQIDAEGARRATLTPAELRKLEDETREIRLYARGQYLTRGHGPEAYCTYLDRGTRGPTNAARSMCEAHCDHRFDTHRKPALPVCLWTCLNEVHGLCAKPSEDSTGYASTLCRTAETFLLPSANACQGGDKYCHFVCDETKRAVSNLINQCHNIEQNQCTGTRLGLMLGDKEDIRKGCEKLFEKGAGCEQSIGASDPIIQYCIHAMQYKQPYQLEASDGHRHAVQYTDRQCWSAIIEDCNRDWRLFNFLRFATNAAGLAGDTAGLQSKPLEFYGKTDRFKPPGIEVDWIGGDNAPFSHAEDFEGSFWSCAEVACQQLGYDPKTGKQPRDNADQKRCHGLYGVTHSD